MSHFQLSNPADGNSAFDFMALLGRCMGNFKIIERVIAAFRDVGANDLNQLQSAMEIEDYGAFVEIAHRFKGAACNVSAIGLSSLLLQAEQSGRARDRAEVQRIMAALHLEWGYFKKVVNVFAPELTNATHGLVEQSRSNLSEKRHACSSC